MDKNKSNEDGLYKFLDCYEKNKNKEAVIKGLLIAIVTSILIISALLINNNQENKEIQKRKNNEVIKEILINKGFHKSKDKLIKEDTSKKIIVNYNNNIIEYTFITEEYIIKTEYNYNKKEQVLNLKGEYLNKDNPKYFNYTYNTEQKDLVLIPNIEYPPSIWEDTITIYTELENLLK